LNNPQLNNTVDGETSVSNSIRNFICEHQGSFIQYTFISNEIHKKIENETYCSALDFGKNYDIEKIREYKDKLFDHLNEKFAQIAFKSFETMKKVFASRHPIPPRICLKANIKDKKTDKIITIFRDQQVEYTTEDIVEQNTGFLHVKNNGTYFLCQNIPDEAKRGNYLNPRLDQEAVRSYLSQSKSLKSKMSLSKNISDDAWKKCWKSITGTGGIATEPDSHSCYKSTLIIPLTLLNSALDSDFIKAFNMKDVDRTILGYLCFDHIESDFFSPNSDVDYGYICADILSLYLFTRLTYTINSTAVREAERILN
jgi:hypothetical protein